MQINTVTLPTAEDNLFIEISEYLNVEISQQNLKYLNISSPPPSYEDASGLLSILDVCNNNATLPKSRASFDIVSASPKTLSTVINIATTLYTTNSSSYIHSSDSVLDGHLQAFSTLSQEETAVDSTIHNCWHYVIAVCTSTLALILLIAFSYLLGNLLANTLLS